MHLLLMFSIICCTSWVFMELFNHLLSFCLIHNPLKLNALCLSGFWIREVLDCWNFFNCFIVYSWVFSAHYFVCPCSIFAYFLQTHFYH
ncbi:hypothetical protein C2G38_227702 [Gigaspora rosea]|uniref:Uncharacterized protein n=1 Tax=Gigaspora rosea TaxID=44941 RepID=A0A397UIC4_9GLOM|nr:hypothetical protein C2G38_227702 [Gigaspora rosea]